MRRLVPAAMLLAVAGCGGAPDVPAETRAPTPEERARAEAFLAENFTPLPGGWTFETIAFGQDGFLRVGRAVPEAPRATVLFVPGYTSSPELASDVLAAWYGMGFEVASLDLPGQGGSMRRTDDPQKTYTGDFTFYGEAVSRAVAHLDAVRQSDGPLIVAGSSFGGHAVLRAAADGGLPAADALMPITPAVMPALDAPKFLVKWFVGRAIRSGRAEAYMAGEGPWQPDDFETYDSSRCGDREDRNFKNAALFITRPELRVGGVSNEWAMGLVTSGEELLRNAGLKSFDRPVAMVTAERDVIVDNSAAERLCDETMTTCAVVRLAGSTHCVVIEDEATQMALHEALLGLLRRIDPDA